MTFGVDSDECSDEEGDIEDSGSKIGARNLTSTPSVQGKIKPRCGGGHHLGLEPLHPGLGHIRGVDSICLQATQ